jgi:hypothetical protein
VAGTNFFITAEVKDAQGNIKNINLTVWVKPTNSATGKTEVQITRCSKS